jgi:hypothetical protein
MMAIAKFMASEVREMDLLKWWFHKPVIAVLLKLKFLSAFH